MFDNLSPSTLRERIVAGISGTIARRIVAQRDTGAGIEFVQQVALILHTKCEGCVAPSSHGITGNRRTSGIIADFDGVKADPNPISVVATDGVAQVHGVFVKGLNSVVTEIDAQRCRRGPPRVDLMIVAGVGVDAIATFGRTKPI